jgi:hypothetical protein
MDGETVKTLVYILVHIAVIQVFITAIVWIEVKGGRIRRKLLTESEPKKIERRIERRVETKRITETTTETETIIETERIQ